MKGAVGVWMVILVDNDQESLSETSKQSPSVEKEIKYAEEDEMPHKEVRKSLSNNSMFAGSAKGSKARGSIGSILPDDPDLFSVGTVEESTGPSAQPDDGDNVNGRDDGSIPHVLTPPVPDDHLLPHPAAQAANTTTLDPVPEQRDEAAEEQKKINGQLDISYAEIKSDPLPAQLDEMGEEKKQEKGPTESRVAFDTNPTSRTERNKESRLSNIFLPRSSTRSVSGGNSNSGKPAEPRTSLSQKLGLKGKRLSLPLLRSANSGSVRKPTSAAAPSPQPGGLGTIPDASKDDHEIDNAAEEKLQMDEPKERRRVYRRASIRREASISTLNLNV